MRRGYQLARWRRRAETINRKAGELFEEIMQAEGGEGPFVAAAHGALVGSEELIGALRTDSGGGKED